MDTRRLSYFVAIYESGNITQAAQVAGVAQPALSQQLALLEQDLGARLFERSRQGVVATPAADRLYHRAKQVLHQLAELRADVLTEADGARQVSVGLPPTLAQMIGLQLAKAVRDADPQISLQLIEDRGTSLARMVETGRLSFAVVTQRSIPTLHHTVLALEKFACISPTAWKLPPRMDLSTLGDVPMLLTSRPHSIRVLVDAAFAQAGLLPNVIAELDSVGVLREAVIAGLGASVLPATLFTGRLSAKVRISTLSSELYRTLLLCRQAQPLSPRAERVERIVRDLMLAAESQANLSFTGSRSKP